MRQALTALIAASAAAFTVVFLPLAAPSSAATCDDVKFIFARGSGQKLNDNEFLDFKSSIKSELKLSNSTLKYSFYELGTSSYGGSSYPAKSIDFATALGAKFSAGKAFSYGDSVNKGMTELKSYIKEISTPCKNTKFVLSGYSQGAQVITMSAEDLDKDKIIYAATFGDPKLYLPEGKGIFPDACRGKNLSPYREYAPNCHTRTGSLGAKNPYQTASWKGKKGLWCRDKDIICGAGLDLSHGKGNNLVEKMATSTINSHISYVKEGIIKNAAKTIVEKLQQYYPNKHKKVNSKSLNRDVIFLLDRTASMWNLIDKYKKEGLDLSKRILDGGGQVALYTYGDIGQNEWPYKLADFGNSYEKIEAGFNNITPMGGGDKPESMLSALGSVMKEQTWRIGATKSIVVLTDTNYHNPDFDGTTIGKIVGQSYAIDPVNIFIINEDADLKETLEKVALPTGGQVFTSVDSLSTNMLASRPNITLPLAEYSGAPGQEFSFAVSASDDIVSYDWDLDFDGNYELTTSSPIVSKTYLGPGSGYITVKATDSAGNSSTTSAKIVVKSAESIPKIANLTLASKNDNSATISYTLENNAVAAFISINDVPIGFTTETNLEITDLDTSAIITLVPLSASGEEGEAVSINISEPEKREDQNPKRDKNQEPFIILAPNAGKR